LSTLKSFFWGVGTAALAAVMAPKVKKMTRPMMEKGKDKAETMVEKGKKTLQEYKGSKKKSLENAAENDEFVCDTALEEMDQQQTQALWQIEDIKNAINSLEEKICRLKKEIGD
jgi:polyhydroxyalkanoate synthesis regulator phasin